MNGVVKATLRFNVFKSFINPIYNALPSVTKRQFTRNLWYMCNSRTEDSLVKSVQVQSPTTLCSCGCLSQRMHTKGEKELVEFLTEEILAEKKAQKIKNIPADVEGFKVHLDGAEVTLTKKGENETINIHFNVNHTVDSDAEAEVDPKMDKPEFGELKSKPQFEVDIVRGKQTLSFTCSFLGDTQAQQDDQSYDDIFGIDEITLYEGEWSDKIYAVAGDVLDGYLYDLLMNLLDEKGVTNDFVQKLSDFSTLYEHSAYIGMLEGLSKFTTGKI